MKRSRRIAYGTCIALACGALLLDRLGLLRRGPQPAEAAPGGGIVAAPSAAPPTDGLLHPIPRIAFPRGLSPWDPAERLRDVFLPVPESTRSGREAAGQERGASASPKTQFVQGHRLQLVAAMNSIRVAVVDGAWLKVGDTLDGCVLREVDGTQARFECLDGVATLRITGAVDNHTPGNENGDY